MKQTKCIFVAVLPRHLFWQIVMAGYLAALITAFLCETEIAWAQIARPELVSFKSGDLELKAGETVPGVFSAFPNEA